jgi:hypothetical protein
VVHTQGEHADTAATDLDPEVTVDRLPQPLVVAERWERPYVGYVGGPVTHTPIAVVPLVLVLGSIRNVLAGLTSCCVPNLRSTGCPSESIMNRQAPTSK